MNYILNIETSTHICSVSLSENGKTVQLIESFEDKTHAELASVFVEDILNKQGIKAKELSAIAISMGPGSYTGLRIGTSIAKGLCYGLNIPLIAVPSLEAMAAGANKTTETGTLLCPLIDARRMEVYCSIYDHNIDIIEKTQALVIDENSFKDILEDRQIAFFGTGAEKCKEIITHPNAIFLDNFHISSDNMSALAYKKFLEKDFEDTAYYEPFYLKEFQAIKSNKSFF